MNNKDLIIIENEKIFEENNEYYCDNIEAKSISEGINDFRKTFIIGRKSKRKGAKKINLNEIKIAPNIFSFILLVLKTFSKKNINYLLISINPYTFFSFIILFIFRKNIFLYLRSSGHEEYKAKYGLLGKLIYHIMFLIVTPGTELIVCHQRLTKKKKYHLVFPSQLEPIWFENLKKPDLDKIKLLYIGRMRIEKGIFNFIEIFKKINLKAELSIVGDDKKIKNIEKNINLLGFGYDAKSLIEIYDSHNIMILPSFTEAHPQVVIEALARKRPVIIFEDINHIIGNKKGIFVSKRNSSALIDKINFIIKNYLNIQKDMEQNKLPVKKDFIIKMNNILK